jgi:hypothetical protein
MKKWIIRIVAVILALGAFAGAGFTAYRFGYMQGAQATGNQNDLPPIGRFERGPGFGNQSERGFHREFSFGGPIMIHRGGFGFFHPFAALTKVALLGLFVWAVYMVFKGNGWQLTLARVAAPVMTNSVETPAREKPKKGKQ